MYELVNGHVSVSLSALMITNVSADVQESPRVGIRWSVVNLNGISYRDAGEYRCRAQNMAGISEAVVSLNVVGVLAEYTNSKNSDQQQTVTKSDSKRRKPKQKSKVMMPRNMTGSLSSPKRVLKTPKAGRDKMKRDRTAVQKLSHRHFLTASDDPHLIRQTPLVLISIQT